MLKRLARWRFFIVVLLTGSLLWFINNVNDKSQAVEKEEEEANFDSIDQVLYLLQFILITHRSDKSQ
jgi:hypothetical protein